MQRQTELEVPPTDNWFGDRTEHPPEPISIDSGYDTDDSDPVVCRSRRTRRPAACTVAFSTPESSPARAHTDSLVCTQDENGVCSPAPPCLY